MFDSLVIDQEFKGEYFVYVLRGEMYFRLTENSLEDLEKALQRRNGELQVAAKFQSRKCPDIKIVASYHGVNLSGVLRIGRAENDANRQLSKGLECSVDFVNLLS